MGNTINKDELVSIIENLINDKTDSDHVAQADMIMTKREAYKDILQIVQNL